MQQQQQQQFRFLEVCPANCNSQVDLVKKAYDLSYFIFSSHNKDIEEWLTRIKSRDGLLIFAETTNGEAVGMLIGHRLQHPTVINNIEVSFHIWICGVKSDFRRNGIMSEMFRRTRNYCSSNLKDIAVLTANTYPERFQAMPLFLIKTGFQEYYKELAFDEALNKKTEKVRFQRTSVQLPSDDK